MNKPGYLDYQVNRLGLWSAAVVIVTSVVAMLLPLDAPEAYNAEHADRIAWLNANRGAFIAGWVNQIVAMLSLSGVLFATAWQIKDSNPLRALLAAMVVLMSVMAFIIPKFTAIWTIPLLAETAASGAMGAQMADSLLLLLNVSIPFSLYTSFDYLGFWLYGVFAVLVMMPLYGDSISSRVAAVALGIFGVLYQVMLVALLVGVIAATEITTYFMSVAMLLLVVIIAMAFHFKTAMAQVEG
ncbi:MAG: hypothetical protein P8P79_13525 [Halioglobus sp.]|nr:hypothetical protein [Halioglobus sp.]